MFQQQLTEFLQLFRPTHFFFHQRHDHNMEIVIELDYLVEILLLHFVTSLAHLACLAGVKDLVDYDIVNVDLKFGQLLDQTLGLVHRQELRNADCHESSLCWVFHVLVYSF
jgi:hypothetical protein